MGSHLVHLSDTWWPRVVLARLLLCSTILAVFLIKPSEAQGPTYTLEVNENSGSGILVMYFQTKGYAKTDSWGEFNGTIDKSKYEKGLYSYTFCHRFQMYYTRPRMYLTTYAYSSDATNELYSEYHLGRGAFRMCKRGTKYCAWHREMPPYFTWIHICMTYDAFRDNYKLFVNGEKTESGSFAGDKEVAPIRPGGVFIIGQDQDSIRGGFNRKQSWSGAITQYNLWDFAMEEYDVENFAQCRSDAFGNVVRWDEPYWIKGDVSTQRLAPFQLCEAEEDEDRFYLFPDKFDFFFYNAFCYNLGGKMPVPISDENYHELMDVTEALISGEIHEGCMHGSGNIILWVAATDQWEEDVWMDPITQNKLAFKGFWELGQPNGGVGENCVRTYIDRKWQDRSCDERFCAICEFTTRMNLTMRGICKGDSKLMEGVFDTEYFIYGFWNLKPHWRGLGKSHIFFTPSSKSWRLESFYDTEKFAEMAADDTIPVDFYPLGRKIWRVESGICQLANEDKMMTLTTCFPNKFTCDDGSCVGMDKRCNLVNDCPDNSDEKDCEILRLEPSYRSELFPRELSNDALKVFVNVSILAFPKINTLELFYTADFILSMRWRDSRLTFYDLRGTTDLNTLDKITQTKIWSPSLGFTNAKVIGGTKVDVVTSTIIQKTSQPAPDDIERALEANVYSGDTSFIIMSREYFIDWTCDYDLVYYPFDTQVCKMLFEMSAPTRDYVELDVDFEGIEYQGRRDLLEYVVGEMMLKQLNESDRKYAGIKVSLALTRRWFYHAISVFLQSVLLLVVAYMTFYYRVDNFQDRIMVSITCMLVIANVQSSINNMVPKTSYLKMIDYFLIYSFNIIIVVMIYHTYQAAHIAEEFAPNEEDKQLEKIRRVAEERGMAGTPNDKNKLWNQFFVEGNKPVDRLADARRINKQGQIIFVVAFLFFQTVFWAVALAEFFAEKNIHMLTEIQEIKEELGRMKVL